MHTKRKWGISALTAILAVSLCFLISLSATHAAEPLSYAKLNATELPNVMVSDAAQAEDREITVVNGGRIGFKDVPQNAEISAVVNFSTLGHLGLIMRAEGENVLPVGHPGWTKAGYSFLCLSNGMYAFNKNQTPIVGGAFGTVSPYETGRDYTFTMKTVNTEFDGVPGVLVSLYVDGALQFSYEDKVDPLLNDGWFAMTATEGAGYIVKHTQSKHNVVNPTDLAIPQTSGNFPATINADGTVTTNKAGAAGYSGIAYTFQTKSAYSVRTAFTPSTAEGAFSLSVGAYKTNGNEMNRPDVRSEGPNGYGWDETGYHMTWDASGQIFFARNGKAFVRVWDGSKDAFTAGRKYEVEVGFKDVGGDVVQVYLKIDGVYRVMIYDRPSEGYHPYKLTNSTVPGETLSTVIVASINVDTLIEPFEGIEKTIGTHLTKDLGAPALAENSPTKFDRNGQVTKFGSGIVAGFSDVEVDAVKSVVNFSEVGTNIILSLRAQGTLDTPWGSGWTNKGYSVYFFPGGQVLLAKDGVMLYEGWAIGGFGFAASTDYVLEIGVVNLNDDCARIYASVDGVIVANFLDTNAIMEKGGYSIFSDGAQGSALAEGVQLPVASSDKESLRLNEKAQLSCTNATGNVLYAIDSAKSTGRGRIVGSEFIAEESGDVFIYASANGLFSADVKLTVIGMVVSISNVPTTALTARGESLQLIYVVSPVMTPINVSFEIMTEKGTGKATLTQSGLLTPIDAGTVVVKVVVDGVSSPEYTIFIKPTIKIENTAAMAVGEVRTSVGYYANCILPSGVHTVIYELISGGDVVSMNAAGQLTAKKVGIFYIRVTVKGDTFEAVSEATGIQVEAPVVTLQGIEDMIVGETLTVKPSINEGIVVNTKNYVLVKGMDCVSIDGDTLKARKDGIVRIKVEINGFSSTEIEFAVSKLVVTLIVNDSMFAGKSQTLSVMFNSDKFQHQKVVYSIKSGSDLASIDGNILTSGNSRGTVVVQAIVDDLYVGESSVLISTTVVLTGVFENAEIAVGSVIDLSYVYGIEEAVASVEYKIIEGGKIASLDGNKLTITGKGSIKLQVVVNGNESEIVTFTTYVPTKHLENWIIFGIVVVSVLVVGVATVVTIAVVRKKKRSKVANEDKK